MGLDRGKGKGVATAVAVEEIVRSVGLVVAVVVVPVGGAVEVVATRSQEGHIVRVVAGSCI